MSSCRLGTLYCLCHIDASKNRKILDPPVMIPSEAPTDNVWNAGVVTDCWRFLSLVSICQLLLQSTQHEPTFYNQFSLVCNRKKKKTSTIILFTVIVNFFFNHFENKLECFEIDPRCHQTAGENISYQIFLVPLCFALSLVSHVLWGVISPALSTKNPRLV